MLRVSSWSSVVLVGECWLGGSCWVSYLDRFCWSCWLVGIVGPIGWSVLLFVMVGPVCWSVWFGVMVGRSGWLCWWARDAWFCS